MNVGARPSMLKGELVSENNKEEPVTHPHPLLAAGVPATPQKSPAISSND